MTNGGIPTARHQPGFMNARDKKASTSICGGFHTVKTCIHTKWGEMVGKVTHLDGTGCRPYTGWLFAVVGYYFSLGSSVLVLVDDDGIK